MSEIWKPQAILVYKTWIEMILADSAASGIELNDWETKFIQSVWDRLIMKSNLTEAQAKKLEDIYVKYTN